MHANDIEIHEALTRSARDLAFAWQGTDPMRSEAQVREALVAASTGDDPHGIHGLTDELLPYLVDACRERGLLSG